MKATGSIYTDQNSHLKWFWKDSGSYWMWAQSPVLEQWSPKTHPDKGMGKTHDHMSTKCDSVGLESTSAHDKT